MKFTPCAKTSHGPQPCGQCGFEPTEADKPPRRAVNGDPMVLPISPKQQQEAALALQDYRQRLTSKA